jgi:NAD(P)-dependent dehydrogenase (short-subunit alcohol dehydrogenase family)
VSEHPEAAVLVLVLGGTGLIGSAVLKELRARGHSVLALARSNPSAEKAARLGAAVLHGDIATPESWVPALPSVDAVIHAAIDLGSNMAKIDRRLLDVLLSHLAAQLQKPRFLYTGGNWLFGATGDAVATEESAFAPLPSFAWMVAELQRVLESSAVDGMAAACSSGSAGRRSSGQQSAWSAASPCAGPWCATTISPCFTRWHLKARQADQPIWGSRSTRFRLAASLVLLLDAFGHRILRQRSSLSM